MLEVAGLTKRFGGFVAVNGVDFTVEKGEIPGRSAPTARARRRPSISSPGPCPLAGSIRSRAARSPECAHRVCRLGLARTFQIPRPFRKLSLRDNAALSAYYAQGGHVARAEAERRAVEALDLVGLPAEAGRRPWGWRRRAQKARARPRARDRAAAAARRRKPRRARRGRDGPRRRAAQEIRRRLGITIVWVEHIMGVLMRIVDRVVALDHGEKNFDGSPEAASRDERVAEVYLGRGHGRS